MVVAVVFAYIFYRSRVAVVVFLIPTPLYFREIKKLVIRKRRQEVTLQFKELCNSLCAQMVAGYSVENAVREAYYALMQMYEERAWICRELKGMLVKMKFNITVEDCFEDFGNRSGIEEIQLFAQIVKTAKRSGGDVIEIVKDTASSISQRIEVEREIRVLINAKKMEQRIMDIVPLLIVLYVDLTAKDMMKFMYHGLPGRLVMTVCLVVYLAAFAIGEKITQIKM